MNKIKLMVMKFLTCALKTCQCLIQRKNDCITVTFGMEYRDMRGNRGYNHLATSGVEEMPSPT
jgi:hypothetical protein